MLNIKCQGVKRSSNLKYVKILFKYPTLQKLMAQRRSWASGDRYWMCVAACSALLVLYLGKSTKIDKKV